MLSHTGVFVVIAGILLGIAILAILAWREARDEERRLFTDHTKIVNEATRIERALPFNDARDGHFPLWPRDQLDALTNEQWALHCQRRIDILGGHTRKEGTT